VFHLNSDYKKHLDIMIKSYLRRRESHSYSNNCVEVISMHLNSPKKFVWLDTTKSMFLNSMFYNEINNFIQSVSQVLTSTTIKLSSKIVSKISIHLFVVIIHISFTQVISAIK